MVNTFLPYMNFRQCARTLDDKRLYKQIVEVKQIFTSLRATHFAIQEGAKRSSTVYWLNEDKFTLNKNKAMLNKSGKPKAVGYKNHPAAQMWFGYEPALYQYQAEMLYEWIRRRYPSMLNFFELKHEQFDWAMPSWWGDEALHQSHRSNLYRKDPEYYKAFELDSDNSDYIWPVKVKA